MPKPELELFMLTDSADPELVFVFAVPWSMSGLLCTGGPIVAVTAGVTSIGSPWGDSEDAVEEESNGIILLLPVWFGSPENGVRWAPSTGRVIAPVGNVYGQRENVYVGPGWCREGKLIAWYGCYTR